MFSVPLHVFGLLPFYQGAFGYTSFTPNCSSLAQPVSIVFSTNTRSTLDIFWSCLFTLITCTRTILHLNVPEQRADRDPGWRGDFKWALKGTWTKTKWMLTTMVAPELLVCLASGNLAHAKHAKDKFQRFVDQDRVPWSLTHSTFVDMGGFAIQVVKSGSHVSTTLTTSTTGVSSPNWPVQEPIHSSDSFQSENAIISAIDLDNLQVNAESTDRVEGSLPTSNPATTEVDSHQVQLEFTTSRYYHLTASSLYMLREKGHLKRLPCVTQEELNARSKSDAFSKAIAVAQISWMGMQLIVRAARGLAISQLELAVVAYSLCGISIYLLSWNTPKDVQVPIRVLGVLDGFPSDLICDLQRTSEDDDQYYLMDIPGLPKWIRIYPEFHGSRISNNRTLADPNNKDTNTYIWSFVLAGMLFGIVHVLAWNFHFPTNLERNLWRIASVAGTVLPVLLFLLEIITAWLNVDVERYASVDDVLYGFGTWATSFLYILARLYIYVEIFRTLFFLPVEAYTSTWTSNIPHV